MKGIGKRARAFIAETGVNRFKSADEIEYVPPGTWAAGRSAKMGAASEGAVLINQAASCKWIEKRTGTIFADRQGFSSGCPESFGSEKCFSLGQRGDKAGALEVTALRAQAAVSFGLACGEVCINLPDFEQGLVGKE